MNTTAQTSAASSAVSINAPNPRRKLLIILGLVFGTAALVYSVFWFICHEGQTPFFYNFLKSP